MSPDSDPNGALEPPAGEAARELHWLLKNMTSAFCVWEMDFGIDGRLRDIRVGYFNDAFQRLVGFPLARVRGRTIREVWPDAEQDWLDLYRDVAQTGVPRSFEMHHKPTGGTYACNVYRPGDTPDRVCVVFDDITEQRQATKEVERLAHEQRSILNTVSAGISHIRNRQVRWVNQAWLEMFGFEQGEAIGASTRHLYAAETDFDRIGSEGYRVLGTGAVYSTEARMRRRNGSVFWCTITGQAVNPDDLDQGTIWTLVDVDERRETENALRRERAFSNAVIESVPGLLYVYDDQGRLVRWNRQHEIATGYSAEDLGRMRLLDWYRHDPEEAKRIAAAVGRIAIDGQAHAEANLETRSGGRVRYHFTAVKLEIDGHDYFVGVGLDVTERVKAEQSIRESQERLELALLGADLGAWDWNIQTGIAKFDARWTGMLGYLPGEVRESESGWEALVHPDDRPKVRQTLDAHLAGQTPFYESEYRVRHKNGGWVWVLARGKVVAWDADGRAVRMAGTHLDITDRRRAQEALEASERRYRRLVQNSNDIIVVVDANGVQKSVAGPVADILGYAVEDLEGANGLDIVHPDDLAAASAGLAELASRPGLALRLEYRVRHREGRWVSVEAVGTNLLEDPVVHGIVLNVRDISQRKDAEEERARLEQQLQQAMKMEAVGRLAGGVAHDFNNLLTTIAGNLELARMDLAPADPIAHNLDETCHAVDRAAELTRQLLAFSRRQIIEPKVLNLNDLVDNLQKMLVRLIGEDIALQVRLAEDAGAVKVDPSQFEQVLVNLAVNARDAMPGGGQLLIETDHVDLDADYCALHPEVEPGSYVRLAVSDTGHGMDDKVRQRIFEPFFTTKPVGRGTGLGLAMIFGVVKQAGGAIEVYSEPHLGTTFKIYLPRVAEPAEPLRAGRAASRLAQGHETILVVEDEPTVREMAIVLLRRLGYTVLQAASGDEALALVAGHADPIDLLITDVVMPGINGRELAERLQPLHPETLVLFTSGYTENVIVHHGVVEDSLNFIGKPYTLNGLAAKVRAVLDAR